MQMTNDEIVRRYKQAAKKREQIKILAELNACPKENIRKILREAGCDVPETGNRYTAAKKAAEEAEADGSERKQVRLTESGKRLLKNEEQEKVGTHQQDVGEKSETRELKTEHTAPTACPPARPVDVWIEDDYDEDTIRFAREELERAKELVEGMEQDIKRRKLEVRTYKCKAEFLRIWLEQRGVKI